MSVISWTAEEDALLTSRWLAGDSASQISRHLSDEGYTPRSRNAIIGRRFRLGLPGRQKTSHGKRSVVVRKPRARRNPWTWERSATPRPPVAVVPPPPLSNALHIPFSDLNMTRQCRAVSRRDARTTETWHCGQPVAGEEDTFCPSCAARFYVLSETPYQRAEHNRRKPMTRMQMLTGFAP